MTQNENEIGMEAALVVAPEVEKAAEVMQKFQQLKTNVLDRNDTLSIQGNSYIKRSGWRKIALAFNVRTEILETKIFEKEGVLIAEVKARAIAPNGRFADEIASCDSTEFTAKIQATRHNILTKATTRSINRCLSDLCGGGEVSAEERTKGGEEETDPLPPRQEKSFITPNQLRYAKGLGEKTAAKVAGFDFYHHVATAYNLPMKPDGEGRMKCEVEKLSFEQASELISDLREKLGLPKDARRPAEG